MTTASEFSSGRLIVSINTSGLPETERMAVLRQAFDYAVGRGRFDELELDPRLLITTLPEGEKLTLSGLAAKAQGSRGARMRIPNPTAGDVRAAVGVAPYVVTVNLLYKGELVAGTSDEISDVDFLVGSGEELEKILVDLRSRVMSPLRFDTAELESPPYFLVFAEADIFEWFNRISRGEIDMTLPQIGEGTFGVEVFAKEGHAVGQMEYPEVEGGAWRLYDGNARLAILRVDRWDLKVAGWSEPRPDELKGQVDAFLRLTGAPVIGPADWETYAWRAAESIRLWHDQRRPKFIRWISTLVRPQKRRAPS